VRILGAPAGQQVIHRRSPFVVVTATWASAAVKVICEEHFVYLRSDLA
jgi:hypothetical protein